MLMMHGADELCDAVLNAKPMPLKYLRTVDDYQAEMDNLYNNGNPKGVSTGFSTLDDLFTLKRSTLVQKANRSARYQNTDGTMCFCRV